jgi:hypothetical protein
MFKKFISCIALCSISSLVSLGATLEFATPFDELFPPEAKAHISALQSMKIIVIPNIPDIWNCSKEILLYNNDLKTRNRSLVIWKFQVRIRNLIGATEEPRFVQLVEHVQYISDNHSVIYQFDYQSGNLDFPDAEAFYWELLAEAKPEHRVGLIGAYTTGQGIRQNTEYAAKLKADWRI